MQELTIPASYDVWLTDLKHYLDRGAGRKAELARHLESCRGMKLASARVKVSELLSRRYMPAADLFLDIATWLQQQQTDGTDSVGFTHTDDIPPRRDVSYTTGSTRRPKVADE